jgi:uncharacterized protein (TIGR02271 family)
MRTVVGLFENGGDARLAIEELASLGFAPQNVSVVSNLSVRPAIGPSLERASLHTTNLSDVGPVALSGPLGDQAEQLGQSNGLAGMLGRLGLSPELAEHYASGVQRGAALESLVVDDVDAERVAAVMKKHAAGWQYGARGEVRRTNGGATNGGPVAAVGQAVATKLEPERIAAKAGEGHLFSEEERVIPVYREELRVGKREIELGAVHVSTHVIEKPYTEQVVLREERVTIERRPADRLVRPEGSEFKGADVDMDEIGEEAVGAKQTRLVEEIIVHKHIADKTATVGDTVRSTQVDVSRFDASAYRSHFDDLKIGGTTFEEQVPAYRFGQDLAPGGTGRWEDIEGDTRTRWEAQHPGTWDKFKDSIRFAYARATKR